MNEDFGQATTGGTIPGSIVPAFSLHVPAGQPLPVLIAAPHGGRSYPAEVIDAMRDPAFTTLRLEDRYVDRLAQAVTRATGATLLIAHAPRAMIDLNRALDDLDWSMIEGGRPTAPTRHSLANRRARGGLGLVPRRLPMLGEIWKRPLSRGDLDARMAGIHVPYHRTLEFALETMRDRWGTALLIDLHSMPPLAPRSDQDTNAEIVLGDRFGASCDSGLVEAGLAYLASQGRAAAHNRPYAGGYVLDRHARPARAIHALQIEVCRATYLDTALAEPGARFPGVVRMLAGMVRLLATELVSGSARSRPSLAAE